MVVQEMISANIAALKLGRSREACVRLIQRGELAGQFVAGRWLVEPGAVEKYLSGRAEQGDGVMTTRCRR